IGMAIERQGAIAKMRQNQRGDFVIVGQDIAFRVAFLGPEDLVEVRELAGRTDARDVGLTLALRHFDFQPLPTARSFAIWARAIPGHDPCQPLLAGGLKERTAMVRNMLAEPDIASSLQQRRQHLFSLDEGQSAEVPAVQVEKIENEIGEIAFARLLIIPEQ